MALVKSTRLGQLSLKNHPILYTAIRNHWNKDFKPAPYPKTQEERLAAAAKYGLVPSEYKPFPDDGFGLGDYPDMPMQSGESRDPFYPWDNPEHKRNFNEPLNDQFDMIGEDRHDINFRHRVPVWKQWFQFLGVMFGTFGIYYAFNDMKMFPGTVPKQYPYQGRKHFTFEPKSEELEE